MTPGRLATLRDRANGLLRNDALMRIAANSGWLLGDRLVRAALGFFIGALVARYLGPADFGHYAYVLTFIAFFQAVAMLGTDNIVVRDIARDPDVAPAILGSTLRLRLLAGMACWLAAVVLAALLDPQAHRTIAMTAIVGGVLVFQAADTVDLWFQSQSQSRRTVMAKLTAYLGTAGVKVVLVLVGAPLIAFVAAFLLDFGAAALALILAYRRFPTGARWRYDGLVARRLLRESWPFLLSGLSITVYIRIDQIMLQALSGSYDVGIYAAAMPLSQIWQMIPTTLAISLAPVIARQKQAGNLAYENALRLAFRLFAGIALLVSLATMLAAPLLVPLIYGPAYLAAVPVLQIHVFGNVFVALGMAQSLWIANEGRGDLLLTQTLVGAAVALAGNWLLIPLYGPIGAAVAAVAAQFTAVLLVNLALARPLFWLQMGRRPG
ncbi:MAG: hypothetical protein RL490_1891 [Pseudomonadota bacterium]|jgi:PST family polysaccharide transporter